MNLPSSYTCRVCGREYPVNSLANDCARRCWRVKP